MQNTEISKPQSVEIFITHTKENFDYYSRRFKDLTNVKVVYEKRTPEEELEVVMNQIMGYSFGERDIYRK